MKTAEFPSLAGQGMIAVDLETKDTDLRTRGPGAHRGGHIAGIAIGTEGGYRAYYPIGHENPSDNLPRDKVLGWLRKQLMLPVPKVGARLIYDLIFLDAAGVPSVGPYWDVQIAEPLIDETKFVYGLQSLAEKYVGGGKLEDSMIAWITKHLGIKRYQKDHIWRAPAAIVAKYAIGDIDLPLKIFKKQRKELVRLKLWDLFELECKLVPMLVAMHRRGVRVDIAAAEKLYSDMERRQTALLAQIKRSSGLTINPWNARSIGQLFDHMGISYGYTEKTHAPSLTKTWLSHHKAPIAKTILDIRRLDKLKETFIRGFILEGHHNGRIHCQFNQLRSDEGGTVTGRFSSSTPNLQQIPVRGDDGKLIRGAFIPERSQLWHKLDYSQIEYRLIVNDAYELDQRGLCVCRGAAEVIEEFNNNPNADYHQIIADMTGLDRGAAKTVNFGLAYGEGINKLCRDLGLSREDGEALLKNYHRNAPFMRPLMNYYKNEKAQIEKEVRTLYNRRRHFNRWIILDGDDKGKVVTSDKRPPNAELAFTYAGLNARIQGSAADIIKDAMVTIWESGVCDVTGVPHLTVHDELDFSSPATRAGREAIAEIKRIMENVVTLNLPLKVDAKSGKNWGSCE